LVSVLAPILWFGTLLGFPGNWGLVGLTLALAYFVDDPAHIDIHSPTLAAIVFLGITGEVLEFIAGAFGVQKLGGTRRGGALAILGSIIGAIVGLFVGIPVPILGSLIAALLFGGLGAFGGAVAGERWSGKEWYASMRIGWGALWGKLLGTILKTICGTAILALILYAVWT
jgi:uncharacterized protein